MFIVARVTADSWEYKEFDDLEKAWHFAIRLSSADEEPVLLSGGGIELTFIDGTAHQAVSFDEIQAKLKSVAVNTMGGLNTIEPVLDSVVWRGFTFKFTPPAYLKKG